MVKLRSCLGAWMRLAAVIAIASCSGGGDEAGEGRMNGPPSGAGASAAGSNAGSGGAAGSTFGNADGGTPFTPPPVVDAGTDGGDASDDPLSEDNACASGTTTAELKPVNMLVMFDRSGSMEDDDKWPNATAALTAFLQDPGADGLHVALRFFPHDEPAEGCTEDGCDAAACSQPLVAIGALTADPAPGDAHEQTLVSAIENSAPGGGDGGGTPIYAALDGALQWATSHQMMHTDEKTVVIFVTDGEPNGCDEDFDNISALAATALADTGVTTYAIGLAGSSEAQMDQLAQAGGTTNGIFIDNSANAEQELLTALNAIRGETLSCDFPIPQPTDPTVPIDPAKINVTFTPASGMAATLPQVADAGACSNASGWHYDTAQPPTRIMLCPSACDLVQSDPDGELQVLIGCDTCAGLDVDCGGEVPPVIPPPE
jgi:hypothetical protein